MFGKLTFWMLGASAVGEASVSDVLLVSPTVAWAAIVSVLALAAVALWFVRDEPDKQSPNEPTFYREAA
jgi:membrane protein implicated in regulation of membrane protease activity